MRQKGVALVFVWFQEALLPAAAKRPGWFEMPMFRASF